MAWSLKRVRKQLFPRHNYKTEENPKDTKTTPLLKPYTEEPDPEPEIIKLRTIATKQEEVDETIKAMMLNSKNTTKRCIGLDTITQTKSREIYTSMLQLYDGTHYLLVRLTHFSIIPESLYNFLGNPGFIFVGFAIKDSLARLEKEYGFVCKNFFEVGCDTSFGWRNDRLRAIMSMYVPPSTATSCTSEDVIWGNFEADDLTKETINLAFRSVSTAFCIGINFLPTCSDQYSLESFRTL